MKDGLRQLKWNALLTAVLYIVLGILLMVFPQTSARTLCWLLGGAALVTGVCTIVLYLVRDVRANFLRNDLVTGIAELALGVFLFWRTDTAVALVPFLAGFVVIVSGLVKLQAAVDMARMRCTGWWAALLLACISLVVGVVLLINPFEAASVLFIVLGAGLVYSGVTDIVVALLLEGRIKRFVKEVLPIEANGKDVSEPDSPAQ